MTSTPQGISLRDAMVPVDEGKSFFKAVRGLGISSVELEVKLDGTTLAARVDGQFGSICNDVAVRSLGKAFAAEGIRISACSWRPIFPPPMPRPTCNGPLPRLARPGNWVRP